jgi:class 3 adenylate cyclase/tetratricopeptide (TPR) repeat protein
MKCPKCQHDNPDDAKFCIECASPMEFHCPNCGAITPATGKFCKECAYDLRKPKKARPIEPTPKDLSFDEKLDKIQRYLPKGLTEKILSQRDKIEGEHKQVTVMFCDMEGFTGLVERLGPEEAYSVMDQVYEILIHKVHDYEGTVNEMTGDGIMALFGAPIALEDAPQRAVRSAYSIHREMARFSDKIRQEREELLPLKMRIGVHTGPVVVGTLGNDLRVEFKAVGDTVNLASRMEGLAQPGTTYVSGETFKLTEGLFRFEALGDKKIRGKEEPVTVYRVIAPSTRRTRFDVSAERGLTPFLGRDRELELLLDGFERSKAGRGQAFSIVSEAGLGKSRLLFEFRKAVAHEDVTFLEGKCLSYSSGVAYHPVIDILKSTFDVREEDGDLKIREKVKRQLKLLGVDEASTLPYLLELISVKDSGIDKIRISPEARKDRIIEAVKQISLKGAEVRPLVIAVEDLHWIDKSSEEYLKDLLDSISGTRIFLILTYRPDFIHTWGGRSYHSQVNLNRLSNRESLAIVTHLLGTSDMDRKLENLILEKTEGVPFFIEEFVKSLKELNIIKRRNRKCHLAHDVQDLSIPSTIHEVIMARVDSLPEGAKEVLQTGSAIEREFSYELAKRVTGLPEHELLSDLSVSKDSELLYERGIYPQSTYIFAHALTREVVYHSILSSRKKKLHERIGYAIEDLNKDNIDEQYGILIEHFIRCDNYEKAVEYSRLAAGKSEKAGSFKDAISHAEKGIACLEKLPLTEEVEQKLIDARTTLGRFHSQMFYNAEAKEAVEPILEPALNRNDKIALSQIYSILGTYSYSVKEDYPKAFQFFEKALALSKESGDIVSLTLSSMRMGTALTWNCEFDRALSHLEKALKISESTNLLWSMARVKGFIGILYTHKGKIDFGYQVCKEALELAEESGDIWSKAQGYTYMGMACLGKGFLTETEEHFLKGVKYCERIKFLMFEAGGYTYLGMNYFVWRKYRDSEHCFSKAISIYEDAKVFPTLFNLAKIGLAKSKLMHRETNIDLEILYRYESNSLMKIFRGWVARDIGEILLNIDDSHRFEAEEWINRAIEVDKKNGIPLSLGLDYALRAELYKRKDALSEAKENLGKAIEILNECGADGWVEKYEEELTALS